MFEERHGDRIGLFTGRAGGRPDADTLFFCQFGKNPVTKEIEMFRLAKEIGLIGGDQIQQTSEFFPPSDRSGRNRNTLKTTTTGGRAIAWTDETSPTIVFGLQAKSRFCRR